jgi:hypothetical protein
MSQLHSNVFRITNLGSMKSRYKLYRIEGLSPDSENYHRNVQVLNRTMSFTLRNPALVVLHNGEPHLVLRDDSPEPPSPFQLVGGTAHFHRTGDVLELDYDHPTDETAPICQRFLQFAVNGALRDDRDLWLPGAGRPFFGRRPVLQKNGVDVFRGFAVRVVLLDNNVSALCVDVKHRYVSQRPLPARMSKADFHGLKGTNCVYHYGNQWYDVKLQEHSGLSITRYFIQEPQGERLCLRDYVRKHAGQPLPTEVLRLDDESIALLYMTGRNETQAAVAQLCYPVFETEDSRIRSLHGETILRPDVRRSLIADFVAQHLAGLNFLGTRLAVERTPIAVTKARFVPPDLLFGHGVIYSVRSTRGAVHIGLDELGRTRLSALFAKDVGTYATEPLDQQYFILPQSVAATFGPALLSDLKATVDQLYPGEIPYDPIVIIYHDLGSTSFSGLGKAILAAVDSTPRQPGYGVVMLPYASRRNGHEDQLASMVMREMRNRQVFVSVIHNRVGEESYELLPNSAAGTAYSRVRDPKQARKLEGYLRNVALTKVLLTNNRCPFVLATPLHADITIGIDVKQHTACFVFIDKAGRNIRAECRESNQKEMLSRQQVKTILSEILRQEVLFGSARTVVVQRDGRFCGQEIQGIKEACAALRKEGVLSSDAAVSFVEIPKHCAASLRLFDVEQDGARPDRTHNPQVGSWWAPSREDGYICSTGRAFPRPGCVLPLHVKYIEGTMPFEEALEDIYALTCLTWTRPEDCTRYPLTLKLADIRLREHAGEYDEDALEYGEDSDGQEADDE